jgi:flagellar export protein FliJ
MNLSAVKQYRGQREDILRTELAELDRAVASARAVVHRLEDAAVEEARQYMRTASEGLAASEVAERYASLEALAESIRNAQEVVEQAQSLREGKLHELLDASREKQQIALLEQKELARHRVHEARREQLVSDESARRRFLSRLGRSH